MKRRQILAALTALASSPLLTSCADKTNKDDVMFSVEIWVDSSPDDFSNSTIVRLASSNMRESEAHEGLFSLATPLTARLPSGLKLDISCERVAAGHFNVGISHDGELASSGKYSGPFTVRFFPSGHSSYVVDVKAVNAGTSVDA